MAAVVTGLASLGVAYVQSSVTAASTTKATLNDSGAEISRIKEGAQSVAFLATKAFPVGSVIGSMLDQGEFARQVNDPAIFDPTITTWVLADGKIDVTRSKYEAVTRKNRVPDLRGQFLRGVNAGRDDSKADPDGDRVSGADQASAVGPHTHSLSENIGVMSSVKAGWGNLGESPVGKPAGPITATAAGLPVETRPRNVAVYWYIRIN